MEIEIQSPYGTKLGAGPITTGRNWRSSSRMNKIGAFSFEMPLNDPRRSLLVQKRYVRCYGMVNETRTELGKPGIIDSITKLVDANGIPTGMLQVKGRDLFAELADINIHVLDIIGTHTRSPDAVEYWDGSTSAYLNMANAHDETGASVEIPADDEDWFYVGDGDFFDIVTFDLGANLNADPNSFRMQYSQGGSSWAYGTILSDTTKVDNASFAQDGAIRWERQEDWATETVNSVEDKYWLRFRYKEDMSGDVTIVEITVTEEFPPTTALADWLAYTDAGADTPIADLGWDFEATHTETENEVFLRLRDVTAFEALTLIAEQTGENFRLGTGRLIEWLQDDKLSSGIRTTNISDGIAAEDNEDICLITNLQETEDSYELVGRVYPQGGGGGGARITLLECTETPPGGYTLSKSANYLKKDSVEVDYGRRFEIAKFWPGVVSPVWASSRDVNSANALYKLTYEYLSRHWEPQKSYIFSVVKLDAEVKVGETIQLVYWQTVEGTAVWNLGITAALHLWVLEMTHAVGDAGSRVVGMQVATIDAWPSSDAGKVTSIVSHIKALQTSEGPISARSLTADTVAELMANLDLSAYYKKPTNTNVILGLDAGAVPPGDSDLVIIGKEAGWSLTTGVDSVLIGRAAGYTLTDGDANVAVGYQAMQLTGTGVSFNVAIGSYALQDTGTTSDGDMNTAIGWAAMIQGDQGEYNVAIGASALANATDGDGNTAVGTETMHGSGTPVNNVAIGYQAMYGGGTSPTGNVAVGVRAGIGLNTSDYNVLIGFETGHSLTTTNGNVFIGYQAGYDETGANKLYIENSNSVTPLIYGEFDNDLVKIYGDLCLGAEDGGGRLNFTEGTTIADGIVWGSDANKVTLYRSADDMLKTDDSLTVGLMLGVGVSPSSLFHLKTSSVFATRYVQIEQADDGPSAATWVFLKKRTTGSTALDNDYIGVLYFDFYNDDAPPAQIHGATIEAQVKDASDTTEDVTINIKQYVAGVDTIVMSFVSGNVTISGGLNVGTATGAGPGQIKTKVASGNLEGLIIETGDESAAYLSLVNSAQKFEVQLTGADDFIIYDRTNTQIVFKIAHTTGNIYNLADSEHWNTTSDELLKRDIAPVQEALSSLRLLEPITFRFNEHYLEVKKSGNLVKQHWGFTAQNFAKVFPEQICYDDKYLTMNTDGLDALIVAGLCELDVYRIGANAEREAIRAEIAGLQERLDDMERRG